MHDWNRRTLLIDTNVVLDLLVDNRPQHAEAMRVAELCNGGGDLGLIAPMTLKDAYYIIARRESEAAARAGVRLAMGLFVIAPLGPEECDRSLHSDEPDFEDGLIRACAELNGVDYILTRDTRAFCRSPVKALSCAEYLELVGEMP